MSSTGLLFLDQISKRFNIFPEVSKAVGKTQKFYRIQSNLEIVFVTKVNKINQDSADFLNSLEIWPDLKSRPSAKLIIFLSERLFLKMQTDSAMALCFLFAISHPRFTALSSATKTHMSCVPLEFIHIYNIVQYCSNTATRNIFIFCVWKKASEAVLFSFFVTL